MAEAVNASQCLTMEVIDAFNSVESSLRTWASEGPPGNQRCSAAALADKLATAISKIQGLTSESASLHEECKIKGDKLADFEREVSALKASIAELKSQKDSQELHFKKQSIEDLAALQTQLVEQREKTSQLQAQLFECDGMCREDLSASNQIAVLKAKVDALTAEKDKLCHREATLATQVGSLLAPVSVMCRMRPLTSYQSKDSGEDDALVKSALSVEGGEISVEGIGNIQKRKFTVDRVLNGYHNTQDDVFASAAPWIENVMSGGSSCIMAYGATGSGKTYTLLGSNGCPGIAHHALRRLLEGRQGGEVKLSMVEVYCDQIRDLLAQPASAEAQAGPPTLQCFRRDARGRMLGCTQEAVKEYAEAEDILCAGFRNRAADATLCNDQSSRSHVVLTVETSGHAEESSSGGRLVLIDLAGSENVQKSGADESKKLMSEATAINRSLSALADVVEAIAKRQSFVPYRNSRLTQLLEETLCVAKVCLLVHVSPLPSDISNTGHSLQFAGRIRSVDFGAQQLRKDQEERLRAEQARKSQENRLLQAQLDDQKKEATSAQQTLQDHKAQIARLSEQLRECKRDLTKEQELRSKLEASGMRRIAASTSSTAEQGVASQRPRSPGTQRPRSPVPQRPRSPLRRQQGSAIAPPPRRIGTGMTNPRRQQESENESSPDQAHVSVHVDECHAAQTAVDDMTANGSVQETGIARVPLADVTNCEDRLGAEGKVKAGSFQGSLLARSPRSMLKVPEVSKEADTKAAALVTPSKSCINFCSVGDDSEPVVIQRSASEAHTRAGIHSEESVPSISSDKRVKSVLRKVPSNVTERASSCPARTQSVNISGRRIKFADQLQEAASPPRWYLDWLSESEAAAATAGRADVKVAPLKGREISPRRKPETRDWTSRDTEPPRWR
jgi:kinesin family protein C2/C3